MCPAQTRPTRRAVLSGGGAAITLAALGSVVRAAPAHAATSVPIRFGAWTEGMDGAPAMLDDTAAELGIPMSIASVFRGRGDAPWWPYNADYALGVNAGRVLLVSWSLQDWGNFSWWSSGKGDAVLRDQAAKLRDYQGTVVLRPWAEMNGDWVDFQPLPSSVGRTPRGGTPKQFIAAWRRVVSIVRNAGATNVKFCFNPTTDTYPGTTDVRTIFPGAAYVDVLGLDGYNWGTADGLQWRSFADIYTSQYDRLVSLHPGAPVWICEVSSADPASAGYGPAVSAPTGSTKATWWAAMMGNLAAGFPAVQAVSFFDADKERDWRIDSSAGALDGLASALRTPPTRPSLTI